MKIHVWVPDYASSSGGIEMFSRFTVRALRDSFPGADLHVFAKNDTTSPDSDQNVAEVSAVGWWLPSQRTLAFTLELLHRTQRERPDLIITTHVNFAPVAYWLKKFFKVPFIAIGHGVEVWEIQSKQVKRALQHADRLLAVSQFTRERMATAIGISCDQIRVLPNTFDPEKFTPASKPRFLQKRYGLAPESPTILTISRLASEERYKGYDQVLRALPAVRERFPDVRYLLGGRGPDRPRAVSLVQELGLGDNVILTGYIPDHALCAHYNLCDVFAMPSKGEGFGIVFLEAAACGKPVIAGNKDGSTDAVLNGTLGVLVDPENVNEIANALIQVLSKTHPASMLYDPHALRRQVTDAYGYPKFAERVKDIIRPFVRS